jgi:hypothetical protein
MRLTVVGNPANRRVGLFLAAARAAGVPAPRVLPWADVLAGAAPGFGAGELVRVDSPGEDAEVDRLLRDASRPARYGEILGASAWYAGLCRALHRLDAAARQSGALLLSSPAEVAVLFDKTACHARLAAAGIPVPAALPAPVTSWAQLCRALDAHGWSRVFVKPRHGSSASGVLALHRSATRIQAITPVEVADGGLFNSLRIREYSDEATVAAIVDRLGADGGLHVERWFPKAGLHGRRFDLRVLVVAGRPAQIVVRASAYPMTNLHLGGVRGDLAAVRDRVGARAWRRALDSCVAVAACFPDSLHVGVDLMIGSDFRTHAVAEANAFGDLLPGLLVDGRDSYATELAALAAGWRPARAAPGALVGGRS